MAEMVSQQGLPEWLFLQETQIAVLAVLVATLLIFLVLLPALVLLRADGTITWSWGVVLVPVWLGNALYVAILVGQVVANCRANGEASAGSVSGRAAAFAILHYTLFLCFQVFRESLTCAATCEPRPARPSSRASHRPSYPPPPSLPS